MSSVESRPAQVKNSSLATLSSPMLISPRSAAGPFLCINKFLNLENRTTCFWRGQANGWAPMKSFDGFERSQLFEFILYKRLNGSLYQNSRFQLVLQDQ